MTSYEAVLDTSTKGPVYRPLQDSTTESVLRFIRATVWDTKEQLTKPIFLGHPRTSTDVAVKLKDHFQQLAREWSKDTIHVSSLTEMVSHPSYLEIIGMGKSAVPLLLNEIQQRPNHWFVALQAITGENPIPRESRGKLKKMTAAWLEWGVKRNYI